MQQNNILSHVSLQIQFFPPQKDFCEKKWLCVQASSKNKNKNKGRKEERKNQFVKKKNLGHIALLVLKIIMVTRYKREGDREGQMCDMEKWDLSYFSSSDLAPYRPGNAHRTVNGC